MDGGHSADFVRQLQLPLELPARTRRHVEDRRRLDPISLAFYAELPVAGPGVATLSSTKSFRRLISWRCVLPHKLATLWW